MEPSTAPITRPDPNEPAAARGWPDLRCILCGELECVRVQLDDVTSFHCTSCSQDFDLVTLETHLADWLEVVRWIKAAPLATQ